MAAGRWGSSLPDGFWRSLSIPEDLIKDLALPPSARYLYMVLAGRCRAGDKYCRVSLRDLGAASGIKSKGTLRAHLETLAARQWVSIHNEPGLPSTFILRGPRRGRGVAIPVSLVKHPQLSSTAKGLYVTVAAYRPTGQAGWAVSQARLAEAVGLKSVTTVRSLVDELCRAGWLRLSRPGRVYSFEPSDPHLAARHAVLNQVLRRIKRENFKGEALMKEMLSVLIADDNFEDNARPGFLVNPLTGERLEFDRWYINARVAFEFNGDQHYRPTDSYPDEEEVRRQRARDLMKAALAQQQGIRLVTVHPGDLTFERLGRLTAGLLPVRQPVAEDPVVRKLNHLSSTYRRRAGRHVPARYR